MEDTFADGARPCDGWWEQEHLGRQPMRRLFVNVSAPRIAGSGTDLVGQFRLDGSISADGHVALRKHYLGRHELSYFGQFDGEGRMWGEWACGTDFGRWMIAFRPAADTVDIVQIRPRGRDRER